MISIKKYLESEIGGLRSTPQLALGIGNRLKLPGTDRASGRAMDEDKKRPIQGVSVAAGSQTEADMRVNEPAQ